MPFPQYPKKYDQEVIITPKQHLHAEREDYERFHVPKSVILCFEAYVMEHYKQLPNTKHETFWTGEVIYLLDTDKEIAIVGNFGIGGPAAGHMLEILIAAGVENFVVVGHAGGLQKSNPIGSLVLCDKAVRDEGLSHHYLPPDKYAYPSSALSTALERQLTKADIPYARGSSWTIDSMYRETKEEINHYAQEGIATVEMELASLFAVATFRQVQIGALLVISDYVAFEDWVEHLHSNTTTNALFRAVEVTKTVLQGLDRADRIIE